MNWFYTEGTIAKIVMDGKDVKFSLTPSEKFLVEKDGQKGEKERKKGTLFLAKKEGDWGAFVIPEDKEFHAYEGCDVNLLLQIKRDHLKVRVCLKSKNAKEVGQLVIM